jgi:tetratricopeptide (TPR) repeat protein
MIGSPRDGGNDARLLQMVEAAVEANDLEKAVTLARNALASGIAHPLLYNLRSYWYEGRGRYREALADLANAVALAPGDPMVQNAYGLCLTRFDRWYDAIVAFEAAAKAKPDFSYAFFNLGWAQERVGELDAARASFEKAHDIDPASAEPLSRLAALAARRSDWGVAEDLANRALAIEPAHALATTVLINLGLSRRDHAQAEALIDKLLAGEKTPPYERSVTLSFLGELRHAQGRYPEAFAAYDDSNRERKKIFGPHFKEQGSETAYSYVEWLIGYFERVPTERWRAAPASGDTSGGTAAHAFLIGFPRSGTTLLENILACNPAIVSLEEKEVLIDSVRAFLANDTGRAKLENASEAELDTYRRLYWKRVKEFGLDVAGKVFVDKQPLATIKLPVIVKLFPDAKILFAIRDPRDVVLSCFRRQFALNQSMYEFLTIDGAARFYAAVMRLGAIYREKFGLPWHVVRHEAVIEDFEAETRRACDFLGVEWTAEMHQFAERARRKPVATPSAAQVVRGLNRDGMAQWRHYAAQMEPALPFLKPWIEAFGYSAE